MPSLIENLSRDQVLFDAKNSAALYYDSPVRSADMHKDQGLFSSTVVVILEDESRVIVQLKDNEIDLTKVALARSLLGSVVPRMNAAPTEYAFFAYVSNFLPGKMWIDVDSQFGIEQDSAIAKQIAGLIARCNLGISSAGIVDSHIVPRLAHILKTRHNLPQDLRIRVENMLANVDSLKELPLALCHIDINKMNILVNPDTLEVTGLIDWEAAALLPLGMSAWCIRYLTVPIHRRQDEILEKSWPVTQAFWAAFFAAIPHNLQHLKSTFLLSAQIGFVLLNGIPESCHHSGENLAALVPRLAWLDRAE
ncbi:hypothetical protein SISSUDRAFT_993059 [Sistotremastrum suecicum HHB10207 ss-3]|uniref:Aminoglycoside phosphotransferase domain-containing protein n=1 Tax=Sistotremastrum suecicum HHB10207 ss-3 TaxID=1314776 RepID=A0A165YN87_9AGAM|nr:hypothetical protein SISSUDRAFT_993059 [Sistotremastrum suecicum HHB10207 ss-3]